MRTYFAIERLASSKVLAYCSEPGMDSYCVASVDILPGDTYYTARVRLLERLIELGYSLTLDELYFKV